MYILHKFGRNFEEINLLSVLVNINIPINWDLSGKLVCLWKIAFLKKSLAKNFVELTRNSRRVCAAFYKSRANRVVP